MENSELKILLERYQRESYGWALSCCWRNPAQAESVLQAVYLKVLEGKARYDGKAAFKTWLFSVIRKTAVDARRRAFLHQLKLVEYAQHTLRPTREISLDEAIYQSEIQQLFRQALAVLPKRQREVLQLVFYHDFSISEAAEIMCVSVGSARRHYERGKKQLRQLMTASRCFDESRRGRERNQSVIPRTEAGG